MGMSGKMVATAEMPGVAYRRRVVVPARSPGAARGSGVRLGCGAVPSPPLLDAALANLVTSTRVTRIGGWQAIRITRGGAGFDERQGVRRRCPALHMSLLRM